MRRRLFNVLSVLSLLLCLGVCVLWVPSHYVADVLLRSDGQRWLYNVKSSAGELWLIALRVPGEMDSYLAVSPWRWSSDRPLSGVARSGLVRDTFWTRRGFAMSTPHGFLLAAPHWSLCVALASLPALWVSRFRRQWARRRRLRHNVCPSCGYDLRASPNRCPECGTEKLG